MGNPARDLADLYTAWAIPKGSNPQDHRTATARKRDTTLADDHALAMKLLSEIVQRMAALERAGVDVTHFRETLPRWQDALLSCDLPWRAGVNGDRPCLGPDPMRLLRALAGQIDLLGSVLAPPQDRIEAALARVGDAETFVTDATDINDGTRYYLLGLLAEIREALNGGQPSSAAPKVAEFVGAATMVAEAAAPGSGTRDRWRDFATTVAANFTGGALVVAAQIAASGIG